MVSAQLRECLALVTEVTRDAGPGANMRRQPGQWSVAEIVEHLQRAYHGTARGFERCLQQDAPMASRASWRQRVYAFILLRLGYFPEGRPAPKTIVPTGTLDLPTALDTLRQDLDRLDTAAARARQRFGAMAIVDHPILGPFTVDQWLAFHLVHTRHHEKQIRVRR